MSLGAGLALGVSIHSLVLALQQNVTVVGHEPGIVLGWVLPLSALACQGVYHVERAFKLTVTQRARTKCTGKYRNQRKEGVMIPLRKEAPGEGWCWQGVGREINLAAALQ